MLYMRLYWILVVFTPHCSYLMAEARFLNAIYPDYGFEVSLSNHSCSVVSEAIPQVN